ncbi:glycogen synthase [Glaciecola sp. 2405UD65-10]|uniref:glycogen synthase n=1 Tax=Glaciecola sp. 2405UD65-10 TaxID=3397244 RepID=UPI003B5B1D5E
MQILFVISEVEDIIKTGGLADVGKALPLALKDLGHEVVIIMPYYKQVAEAFDLIDVVPEQRLRVNEHHYSYHVKELDFHGIRTYLIDHPYFSEAQSPYGDTTLGSNAERFTFLSLSALSVSENISFQPDVVHCNDWHTAMTPYFMHSNYMARHEIIGDPEFFAQSQCVITLHNAAFQGVEMLNKVALLDPIDAQKVYTDNGHVNMLKTGIMYANKVCPVSPTYAKEITSVLGSHGISDVINQAPEKVTGVLNGCDYSQWDPATDPLICENYSASDTSGKLSCKLKLQQEAGLPVVKSVPVIGMICRVTRQKGFDFIMPILEQVLRHKVQIVIMGTGDETITSQLHGMRHAFPDKFAFVEAFKPQWAHSIEAGSDFFLMPSEFEPCGLNQMYSLAYGTLPIVRKVGGLADTIIDASHDNGTGFVFEDASSASLLSTIRNALLTYQESPGRIKQMINLGMRTRFTWESAALQYEAVYLK